MKKYYVGYERYPDDNEPSLVGAAHRTRKAATRALSPAKKKYGNHPRWGVYIVSEDRSGNTWVEPVCYSRGEGRCR